MSAKPGRALARVPAASDMVTSARGVAASGAAAFAGEAGADVFFGELEPVIISSRPTRNGGPGDSRCCSW